MWFLKRQVPPEELVSGLVSATLELTSTRYARIQNGTAGVDKTSLEIATRATTVVATHLQELGLILIGITSRNKQSTNFMPFDHR